MIVYYSIFAFTCIISLFGCFIQKRKSISYANMSREVDDTIKREKSIGLFFALVSFSLLVYFVGMRSSYSDTDLYISRFNNISTDINMIDIFNGDYENKGFTAIMYFIRKYISQDYTVYLFLLSVFNAGAIVKIYYKYSCNFFMSAFLFIASTDFTWMMNGIRQFLAVTLILYFFEYIIEKKTIRFLIVILIAMSIHSTAVLWIPIYLIVHFKPWSKQIWICIILTMTVFFCVTQFTNLLDSALEDTEYAGSGYALTHYTNDDGTVDDGVSIIRVLVSAVPAIIALWRKKYVEEKADSVINICINLSVASVGVYILGVVTSGILVGRVPIYFTLLNFVLLPWLLENTFSGKTKTLIKILCYAFYCIYFYYVMEIQGMGYYISNKLGLYLY